MRDFINKDNIQVQPRHHSDLVVQVDPTPIHSINIMDVFSHLAIPDPKPRMVITADEQYFFIHLDAEHGWLPWVDSVHSPGNQKI